MRSEGWSLGEHSIRSMHNEVFDDFISSVNYLVPSNIQDGSLERYYGLTMKMVTQKLIDAGPSRAFHLGRLSMLVRLSST